MPTGRVLSGAAAGCASSDAKVAAKGACAEALRSSPMATENKAVSCFIVAIPVSTQNVFGSGVFGKVKRAPAGSAGCGQQIQSNWKCLVLVFKTQECFNAVQISIRKINFKTSYGMNC